MDNREAPGAKTVRLGIEKKIVDYNNAGDGVQVDRGLDHWPHGKERPELSAAAMYDYLVVKKSLVARFFKVQALAETSQDTTEFEAVA